MVEPLLGGRRVAEIDDGGSPGPSFIRNSLGNNRGRIIEKPKDTGTNALHFPDDRSARYVVVPKDVDITAFVNNQFLRGDELQLPAKLPKAIISVTGGAQYYQVNSTLDKFVKRGFVKAAHNLGAWIIDGGMDSGVMSYVGSSIQSMAVKDVPCIGVATLSKTIHHERLKTMRSFEYSRAQPSARVGSNLDPNHTHFILVDSKEDAWGGEIGVLNKLQLHLSEHHGIPIIVIALNGGPVTLDIIAGGLRENFATIIIKGTGRACDALAALVQVAYKHKFPEGTVTCELLEKYGTEDELQAWNAFKTASCVEPMNKVLAHYQKLTFFDPSDIEGEQLDIVVLQQFLDKKESLLEKLLICIKWGDKEELVRDILAKAGDRITNAVDKNITEKNERELQEALLESILKDRPAIFNVLCDNHTIFKMPLARIYSGNKYVKRQLNRGHLWFSRKISSWPDRLRDDFFNVMNVRLPTGDGSEEFNSVLDILTEVGPAFSEYASLCSKFFTEPPTEQDLINRSSYIDLLIWAVFVNRMEFAKAVWRRTTFPVHSALMACNLYRFLSVRAIRTQEYIDNSDWFEKEAVGIMNSLSYDVAVDLISFKSPAILGNTTLEDLAAEGECKEFMSHPHFQQHLDELMYTHESSKEGIVSSLSNSQLVLGIIGYFPMMVGKLFFSKETEQPKNEKEEQDHEEGPVVDQNEHDRFLSTHPTIYFDIPIVKFWTNSIFYLVFLFFQAYVLLHARQPHILVGEYLLWAWIISFALAEIPQIIGEHGRGYFSRFSNKVDLILIVLHLLYAVLRLFGVWDWAISFFLVACIVSWLRLMSIFPVSSRFGPLFFILARLVSRDLVLWGVLFTIFAVSFQIGFASLAIQAGFEPNVAYPDASGVFPVSYVTIIGEWDYLNDMMTHTPIGVAFLAIYAFIVQVMLVNLLIAMMGDTYSAVRENSDVEWKYYRRAFIRDNVAASSIPAPLNVILIIRWVVTKLHKQAKPKAFTQDQKQQEQATRAAEEKRLEQIMAKVMRKTVDEIAEAAEKEETDSTLYQVKMTHTKILSESRHTRKLEEHVIRLEQMLLDLAHEVKQAVNQRVI